MKKKDMTDEIQYLLRLFVGKNSLKTISRSGTTTIDCEDLNGNRFQVRVHKK